MSIGQEVDTYPERPGDTDLDTPGEGREGLPNTTLTLLGIGLLTAAVYLLRFTVPMGLSDYIDQPLIDLPKIVGENVVGLWYYLDTILLLFALYFWGYRSTYSIFRIPDLTPLTFQVTHHASRNIIAIIVGFPILFSLALLLMFPVTAGDLFVYIFFGRIWVFQGLNPYLVTPNMVPTDLTHHYTVFRNFATVYGALFTHLSAALAWLAGDSLILNVLLFKGAMLAFHALASALVYWTLRSVRPALAWVGVFLVWWNPLVLFNAAGDGHNDIAMMAVVMLALYLVSRGQWGPAGVALVLSASMKWASLLLVPMFIVGGLRALGWRRWPTILGGLALGLGLAALLHAPFYEGPASILGSVPEIGSEFTASLAIIVREVLVRFMFEEDAARWARLFVYALFGVLYVVELARVRGDFTSLAYGFYQAFFLYLLVGTLWFQPWYVTWLVGIGAVLVGTPVALRTIAFTFSAMLIHVVTGFGWRMEWFNNNNSLLQLLAVVVVFGLPLMLWLNEMMSE